MEPAHEPQGQWFPWTIAVGAWQSWHAVIHPWDTVRLHTAWGDGAAVLVLCAVAVAF